MCCFTPFWSNVLKPYKESTISLHILTIAEREEVVLPRALISCQTKIGIERMK
jgi:hypothetical protein